MISSRSLRACVAVIFTCLAIGCGPSAPETPPAVGKGSTAPAWTGVDLIDGDSISFPEVLEGKPGVLIFWATWCGYCKAFMPYAKDIEAEYQDQGVKIVTFNAKERGRGDPRAYVAGLDFPMIAIENADAIAEQYDVEFIPGLMVVDGTGQITYRRGWTDLPAGRTVAEQWDSEVREALDLIAGNAPELVSAR